MHITALIAAAGNSTRMGRCKALLPFGGVTIVEHLVEVLNAAKISQIVVTVPEDRVLVGEIARRVGSRVAVLGNRYPELQLWGSVLTGVEAMSTLTLPSPDQRERGRALLVCPVDMPFFSVDLIELMRQKLLEVWPRQSIIVPVVSGQRGHPLLWSHPHPRPLPPAGERMDLQRLMENQPGDVYEVPWHDPRILCNINTPQDYERLVGFAKPFSNMGIAAATDAPGANS